jgi:organic radical activating enzyme
MKKQSEQQISFCWDIFYACNYRCPYCWFDGRWTELARQNTIFSIEQLLKYWKKIYDRYGSVHIEIIGGEPFLYPNFKELIKQLSKMHSIGITTNLSISIDDLVENIDTSRIKIQATFHPLFAKFDDFIKQISLLKKKQMSNSVYYLAYPPQIRLIKYYKQRFNEYGVSLDVMSFWGEYQGVQYPQGYTLDERNLLDPYLGKTKGEKFQLEPKKVNGKLCRAGQIYADIKADGMVYRCGGSKAQKIGNLFSEDFKLLDNPMPCESEFCPCNEWAFLLVNSVEPAAIETDNKKFLKEPHSLTTQLSEDNQTIDRKSISPNYVFITWDIHYGCNYNCTYCNTPKPWNPPGSWERGRDKVVYPGIQKWIKIWEDIYKLYGSCEIHITGGEPFIYPSFMELITHLSKIHTLEIITNLAWDPAYLVKNLDPMRIRIGTTFHPEFANLEEFIKKHLILKEAGFETWVNYVAYPPIMDGMQKCKSEFDKLGISFNIQPYLGWYQDKEYPAGYTSSELSYLRACYDNEDIINKKTIEWKTGAEKRNMKGKVCRMGQMYAKVYPTGDAYRCCAKDTAKLGNLINGTFKLLDEPFPCEAEHCFCWRCMIVGQEDNWAQHWVIPHKIQ